MQCASGRSSAFVRARRNRGRSLDLAAFRRRRAGLARAARKTNGTLWCWGSNSSGQLGSPAGAVSPVPLQVLGLTDTVTEVSAGGAHTCAIETDRTLWCWGSNTYGPIGNGTTTDQPAPVQIHITPCQ